MLRRSMLALAAALLMAGCGGDDEPAADGTTGVEATEATASGGGTAATAAAEGDAQVEMVDIAFEPGEVTVATGGTVVWTNEDGVAHTVTKESGPGEDFDSGDLEAGGTFEVAFDQSGTVEYLCTIHSGMAGTVVVES